MRQIQNPDGLAPKQNPGSPSDHRSGIDSELHLDVQLETKEMSDQINRHLKNLPPKCREVFYKSRFENLKNDEIADQLNISKRTVETHISHALRYLKGVKELLIFLIFLGW